MKLNQTILPQGLKVLSISQLHFDVNLAIAQEHLGHLEVKLTLNISKKNKKIKLLLGGFSKIMLNFCRSHAMPIHKIEQFHLIKSS